MSQCTTEQDAIERLREIAHRDEAKTVTVRADDLRAVLATLRQSADSWRVGDEVERVAHHLECAVEFIEKHYPNARQLDRGPIISNMRRWAEKLRAALAAQGQGEAVAWPIDTDDDVERVAKAAGWDNRRYMTPADYAVWCSRMREFVRLAAEHPATAASPAGVPDGMVLVREALLRHWMRELNGARRGDNAEACAEYLHGSIAAMLAAAPSAPEGDGGEG